MGRRSCRSVWVVLGAALLAATTGCAGVPSSSPSTAPSGSVSATTALAPVELGTDPGAAAYRSLDLCALVDPDAVLAGASERWDGAELKPQGPGRCVLGASQVYVAWGVSVPREDLPTALTAPTTISDTVDVTPEGTVVVDVPCGSAHVAAAGYVVSVDAMPGEAGVCPVVMAVASAVRAGLAAQPPQLDLPDGSVSRLDLCERFAATVLGQRLDRPMAPARADGRVCTAEVGDGGRMVVRVGHGPRWLQQYTRRNHPADRAVVADPGGCSANARVDDGGAAAGAGAYWVTLAVELGGSECAEGVVEGLEATIKQMLDGGEAAST